MTSKIVVNNIGSDTGINTVTFDSNVQRGTSNLHSTGLNVSDTFLHSTGLNVGTGATIHQPADNVMTLGTNGVERLRINSVGITSVQGVDDQDNFIVNVSGNEFAVHTDGSDGEISLRAQDGTGNNYSKFMTFFTHPSGSPAAERLRIGSSGQIGIGGANYGTSGQVLTSQGSGSAVQWASPSAYAFVKMDSQYFTSSVTLLMFNPSTAADLSSGVTIDRTNERFTPTVSGIYKVSMDLEWGRSSAGGAHTIVLYLYKNGSEIHRHDGLINYSSGYNDTLTLNALVSLNGSGDYVDVRASHNAGGNSTMRSDSTFVMSRVGA